MPFLGLGLHILIAIYFATHAVRTGQDRYWLWILFAFPGLGSIVYGLTIWLPQARHSREGHAVVRGVRRIIDPDRELRLAQDDFDATPTTDRRLRLGDALLAKGRATEAATHFESALSGVHKHDPDIQVRLARAWLAAGRARDARGLLDEVIQRNPSFRSQDGHLTYARAVVAEGDRERAREEFNALTAYSGNLDIHAEYAETLRSWGEHDRAAAVCEKALAGVRRMPAYNRRLYKDAISRMKRMIAELSRVA